ADRKSHLGNRRLEIARHVDGERFQRRDIERVEPRASPLRQRREIDQARQETGQRLSAAGRRDQQDGFAARRMLDQSLLVGTNGPTARGKPRRENRGERGATFLTHCYGGGAERSEAEGACSDAWACVCPLHRLAVPLPHNNGGGKQSSSVCLPNGQFCVGRHLTPTLPQRNAEEQIMYNLMLKDGILKGKRILVTGGGTGLGEVMSEAYAQLGATVYICGRRKAVLDETAKKISGDSGSTVKGIACDIRVAEAVDDMVAQIWADGGALTGLVNNAAGNFISRTKDLSPRGFNAIADIVFRGSFYVTLACGKRWIEEQKKASVISILTTWIWNGGPFTVPSAMSKAGLNIMTKSLAQEWGPNGIRLNAIAPGPFPTKGAWE